MAFTTAWYCPWMGVITDGATVEDARDQTRAWLVAHGSTDGDVTEMFVDYPYDTPAFYVDGGEGEGEYSGFCGEDYPGAYPVWVVMLPQGYYFTHPYVIRD